MKLLMYSHFFAPSIGGVETEVMALAKGLSQFSGSGFRSEFKITFVTQTPRGSFDDSLLPFPVVRQPNFNTLRKLISSADVIHVAGPAISPVLLGVLLRKPVVVEHHGYQAICPTGMLLQQPAISVCPGHFRNRQFGECYRCLHHESPRPVALKRLLIQFLRLWLCSRVSVNIAITEHVQRRVDLPRSTVILYAVPQTLSEKNTSQVRPPAGETLQFGFLGRLVVEKGGLLLMEAAGILRRTTRNFRVTMIGDGPERSRIEEAIARQNLQEFVHLKGFLQGNDLQSALASIDVLIMPSICEETAGLAAMESMMQGRPVIASRHGGLGEIVGEAGLTFDPTDPAALAACMERAIRDRDLLPQLGRKGKDRADRLFDLRTMIEKHANVYSHLPPNRVA